MISKQALKAFLDRELEDYTWIKNERKRDLEAAIQELEGMYELKTDLFTHQLAAFYIGACLEQFLFFLDMGGGKTLISLALADYWRSLGKVKRTLVIVPNVTNVEGWREEIEKHTQLSFISLHGTKAEREASVKKEGDVYVINYDGLQSLMTDLVEVPKKKKRQRQPVASKVRKFVTRFDMVVFDEIHRAKNPKSLTYRLCNEIAKVCHFRYGLTGTPFGRDPEDLWAQFYLIDRGETLGKHLNIYREAFFTAKMGYFGGMEYKLNPKMEDALHKTTRNRSIRYADTEFSDLPPRIYRTINVKMSTDAHEWYKGLLEDAIEVNPGDKNSTENYYIKMRQIASGFVYTEDDESHGRISIDFSSNEKLDALQELIEDMPEDKKAVVFHNFNHSGELITQRLKSMKVKYATLNSQTKDVKTEYGKFKTDAKCKVYVVNIQSGSTGLNLQNANYVIYYEPTDRPIWRRQSEKRVHRQGQKHHVFVYDLVTKNSVEQKILRFLAEGKSLFEALVEGRESLKSVAAG